MGSGAVRWLVRGTRPWIVLAAIALLGCPTTTPDDDDSGDDDAVDTTDEDGDGFSPAEGDCDDNNAAINPLADEACDGLDNDCDDAIDEDHDVDGDGTTSCGADGVPGNDDDDCDDMDAALNQADADGDGDSTCDGDCDDNDAAANLADADGDGAHTCNGDCDDADAAVYPGAPDVCDGVADNDCDGFPDEQEDDGDGDGYSECDGDCDDISADNSPDGTEVCDGLDNNCDGTADEDFDTDTDGVATCGADGIPGTADDDCDDGDATAYPGAPELCDGVDNDCNTVVDDVDADGDGHVDDQCAGDDCDDTDATVYTGAPELCDGLDNDCDGVIPDDVDDDGDGYTFCDGDCDDTDADVNPGMTEVFGNGIDDDCDGKIDVVYDHGSLLEDLPGLHGDGDDPMLSAPVGVDLDGDGTGDLVTAGLDDAKPLAPETYFFAGRHPWPAELDHTMADGQVDGEPGEASFPCAPGGDVDDDGFEDVFCRVGDDLCLFPGSATPWPVGTTYQDGVACVQPDPADAGWRVHSARGLGDVDGDGVDDVMFTYGDVVNLGTPQDPVDYNRALELHVFFGGGPWADGPVTASDADLAVGEPNRMTTRVQTADLDDDGALDLLICNGSDTAGTRTQTYLFYGGPALWVPGVALPDVDATFVGLLNDGSGFDECARAAGDLDGDGYGDLHYEALGDGDRFVLGDGSLYSGTTPMAAWDFELTLPDLTEKQTTASFLDFNDDGIGDVALGLAHSVSYDGWTHVFLGRAGLSGAALWTTAGIRFTGPGPLPWGGAYSYAVGDVTGDGVTDLVIGSVYRWTADTQWWYLAAGYSGDDPSTTDDDGDGYTELQGDCDDSDAARYPGAPEPVDFTDWDCDGVIADPGVVGGTLAGDFDFDGMGGFTGNFVFSYTDVLDAPICDHTFPLTGTTTVGSYGNECPSCTEEWSQGYTDGGSGCLFDPTIFGLVDTYNDGWTTMWATDVPPLNYCIGDDCTNYPLDLFIDYWINTLGMNPVIYVFGPDLTGVGHPEFIGLLEPITGTSTLPASGTYSLYTPWTWTF